MSNKVIVFDIDGTLADNGHRVGFIRTKPKNWNAYHAITGDDVLISDIAYIHSLFVAAQDLILFGTGRNESQRIVTTEWLNRYNLTHVEMFMRKDGDYRDDGTIKSELLDQIIEKYGFPYLWFDDRNRVVEAIRARGVRVLQVREGNF